MVRKSPIKFKKMYCSICLRSIRKVTKFQIDPCGHTFHKHCIDEWAGKADSCPNCRGKLTVTIISNTNEGISAKRKREEDCLHEPKRRRLK